jgi:hypothetical protein
LYFLGLIGMYLPRYAILIFINRSYRSIYTWH